MSQMDLLRVRAARRALLPCWVLAALGSGCVADVADEASDRARTQGQFALTMDITERSPGGFDVDAQRDNVHVNLELRRGDLRQQDWRGDPAIDGFYEGDVLVADAQGRIVLIEVGGHQPVESSWLERMAGSQGAIVPALRRQELTLAAVAASLLAVDDRLDYEARLLAKGLTASLRATLEGFDDGPSALAEAQPDPTDRDEGHEQHGAGALRQGLATTYVHQAYIRGAVCCWVGYHHSATRLRVFDSSGALVSDTKRRNHGSWVDAKGMTTAAGCPKSWGGRTNQQPFFAPHDVTDTFINGKAGGCNTSYGPLPGQHVCNDDSYAQYSQVKDNLFLLPNYVTCGDSSVRTLSPACF